MKEITLSIVICLFALTGFTQTATERIYIKGGNAAWDNFMKEVYHYPAFEMGIVEYKDGKRYKSNLNYNKVLGTLQFIDEKGDTLALSNEESISNITIGNDIFFYAPVCMQEIKKEGSLKLVKNERVRIADTQKTGGYGIPNSTGSIESIDRADNRVVYTKLEMNETLLISKVTSFYLISGDEHPVPASKKNILSLFPKHESSIKAFIKNKNIDFAKENDLVELTGYISHL